MYLLKLYKNFYKTRMLSFFVLFFVFTAPSLVFAVWDGSPYSPGSTLNPECSPTIANCNVTSPVSVSGTVATSSLLYTSNTNTWAVLTVGSNGKILKINNGALVWGDDSGGTSYLASGQGLQLATSTNTFSIALDGATLSQGVSGLKISDAYTGQASITTLGTITTGAWQATPVGILYGGTGTTTTPQNGQLLIGNGTGYRVANITGSGGVAITNGSGSLDVGLSIDGLGALSSMANNDYFAIYSTSTSANKKISYNNLFGGILGALNYRGAWNASTNSPTLNNAVCTTGTKGYYYVVSTSGSTTLSGISIWNTDDWLICNGTDWERLQSTNNISTVFGRSGAITAQSGDYTANKITNIAAGTISATNVQNAIDELATEKEAVLTAGVSAQYYRGDKTWQTLDTSTVTENALNLYYTDARARSAISSLATGLTYSTSTGTLALTNGYIVPLSASTTEWASVYGWGNHADAGYLATSTAAGSYLTLTGWYATTTSALSEGATNLYWTDNRFDTRLSATTTLPNLLTLLGLNNASTSQLTVSSNAWLDGNTILTSASTTQLTNSGLSWLTGTTTLGIANVADSIVLASTTPSITTNALYNNAGALYWNGSAVGGGASGSEGQTLVINSSGTQTATSTIFISTASNVGVGTLSPTAKLHIGGVSGTDGLRFPDGTFMTTAFVGSSNNLTSTSSVIVNANSTGSSTPYSIIFQNNASELARFIENGSLGIGTTSPAAKLSVAGDSYFTATSTFAKGISIASSTPSITTNALYNNAGALYWNGSDISTTSTSDWTFAENYGETNLTATSTMPIWTQGALYASSTLDVLGLSTFGNASSTALSVSGQSWFTGDTTLGNASSTNQSLSGYLTVAGQTTLGNASSTQFSVSGPSWFTGLTILGNATSSQFTNTGLSWLTGTTTLGIANVADSIVLASTTPSITTNALYNNGGTLKWNGLEVTQLPTNMSAGSIPYWNGASWVATSTLAINTNGSVGISGDLIPTASSTYSLGSNAYPFRDFYVASSTIYIGGVPLSNSSGSLYWNNAAIGGGGGGGATTLAIQYGESITAGDAVQVTNNGGTLEAMKVVATAASDSISATSSVSTSISNTAASSVEFGTDKVVTVYVEGSSVKAVVGTVSGDSVSFGTPVNVNTAASAQYIFNVAKVGNDKVIINWSDNSTGGYVIAGTVSGSSITFGASLQIVSSDTYPSSARMVEISTDKVMAVYENTGTVRGRVLSLSGTTITAGTENNFGYSTNSGSYNYIGDIIKMDTDKYAFAYHVPSSGMYARVGTVTGTTVNSPGAAVTLISSVSSVVSPASLAPLSTTEFAVLYSNTSYSGYHTRVCDVSGTTITMGPQENIAVANFNSSSAQIELLSPGRVILTYRGGANTYSGTSKIGDVNSVSNTIVFGSDSTFYSGSSGDAYEFFYMPSTASLSSNNKMVQMFKNGTDIEAVVFTAAGAQDNRGGTTGIAQETGTIGQTKNIEIFGGRSSVHSGLTPGQLQYVNASGTPTTVDTGYLLGRAISSTEIALIRTIDGSTSDKRLKENVLEADKGLADLLNIEVKEFSYIGDSLKRRYTGFIAQDLYNIFPDAVTPAFGGDPLNNPWRVDYGRLTPLLVKAIQELNQKIDEGVALDLSAVKDLALSGALEISGHTAFGSDTVGVVALPAKAMSINIAFENPYRESPVVTISPMGRVNGQYWLGAVDGNGFVIELSDAQLGDMNFSWHAFGKMGPALIGESAENMEIAGDGDTNTVESSSDSIEESIIVESELITDSAPEQVVQDDTSDSENEEEEGNAPIEESVSDNATLETTLDTGEESDTVQIDIVSNPDNQIHTTENNSVDAGGVEETSEGTIVDEKMQADEPINEDVSAESDAGTEAEIISRAGSLDLENNETIGAEDVVEDSASGETVI